MAASDQVIILRERITDEIFAALGMNKRGFLRRLFGWMFRLPTSRFAHMFSEADAAAESGGLGAGCKVVVEHLSVRVKAACSEHLQVEGPLMVLSNHPGAYDSVAIGSQVSRRDFSIIAGEIPFYHALPAIGPRLIFVPPDSDKVGRMVTLRKAIDHLQRGGALLQFGAGTIEPDPAVQPGAVEWLGRWSPSVEIMLRKAPETRVVLAAASGVLMERFFRHPFTLLRKKPVDKRRVAEFLQVINQLARPGSVNPEVHVRFGAPISGAELARQAGRGRMLPVIVELEKRLLMEHAAEVEGLVL